MAEVIHELFYRTCERLPDKTAVLFRTLSGWERVTYAQLRVMSLQVTQFLLSRNARKGETCCLCLENRPEWPAIYMGISAAGMTCVPLDVELSGGEIRNFCANAGVRFIFCSWRTFESTLESNSPAHAVVLDSDDKMGSFTGFRQALAQPNRYPLPSVAPGDIASLLYTSGTTGNPKGVLLTHRNFCFDAASILATGIGGERDNFLSILPLYHSYPFMITLLVPLFAGAVITYPSPGFKPRELAAAVHEAKVTIFTGVPQLFALLHASIRERIRAPRFLLPAAFLLARRRLRREFGTALRLFASGGSRLDPPVGEELGRLFGVKVIEGYGLTETSPVDTLNPPRQVKFGSVGKPLRGVELKILSPSPSGEGEIAIRGANVMAGYYKDPGETRTVITGGWFHTGDLGYFDEDGYLYITNRAKEAIILGSGKTVYPEELEEKYAKGPYIKEVFVYPEKEERFGAPVETLHAVVVPDVAYFRQRNEANFREKVRWELQNASLSLAPYKRIMGFTVTTENLPRTRLGKIKRAQAIRLIRRISAAAPEKPLTPEEKELWSDPRVREMADILERITGRKASLHSSLELDLGLDSLSRVQFELELEKSFSVDIPGHAFDGAYTVEDAAQRLLRLIRRPAAAPAPALSWHALLASPPSPAISSKVRLEPTLSDKILTGFAQVVLRCLFTCVWFLQVRGIRHLPPTGPLVICCNHASYLDGPAVFCSLPFKTVLRTYFVGFEAIYERPLLRWAMRPARLVPISPDTNAADSLRMVAFLLRRGKNVCVFPEGQRSADGSVFPFKRGVGILVKEEAPSCLPVFIRSFRAWPRQKRLPRLFTPVTLDFGRPVSFGELRGEARKEGGEGYRQIAEALRREVIRAER